MRKNRPCILSCQGRLRHKDLLQCNAQKSCEFQIHAEFHTFYSNVLCLVESVGTKTNKLPVAVFLFCPEQNKPIGVFEIQLIKKLSPKNYFKRWCIYLAV